MMYSLTFLNGGEADPLHKADGKGLPGEDGGERQRGDGQVCGQQGVRQKPAADEKGGQQERGALQVASCYPELGGEIGVEAGEEPHALVGEGVQQVDAADAEVGDADGQQIPVGCKAARVPGNDEYPARNDHGEELNQHMEQNEAVKARQVEPGKDSRPYDQQRQGFGRVPVFGHGDFHSCLMLFCCQSV